MARPNRLLLSMFLVMQANSKGHQVLLIGYEKVSALSIASRLCLRLPQPLAFSCARSCKLEARRQTVAFKLTPYCRLSDSIKTCVPPIGLIICDEGHRLKSKDNKTTKMFDSLSTKRRISKIRISSNQL
jgi:hypothetical protein